MQITRLAPSPTGALHLGNARTFLVNWVLARQRGWRVLLRIDDLDGPRIKKGADLELLADLRWLGLDWDEGPIYQSSRIERYKLAITALRAGGHLYPCICSRSEIDRAASAPHAEDGSTVYPGTCRDNSFAVQQATAAGRMAALRFRVETERVMFVDQFRGGVALEARTQLGDFVVAKGDGTPAYQLATVVDDVEMSVTQVVRGDDLLDSTARQILLCSALGYEHRLPSFCHLPLVVGQDGRRLAKRHGDTKLSTYREAGVPAGVVRAYLARTLNVRPSRSSIECDELISQFVPERVSSEPIVFGDMDEATLHMTSDQMRGQ